MLIPLIWYHLAPCYWKLLILGRVSWTRSPSTWCIRPDWHRPSPAKLRPWVTYWSNFPQTSRAPLRHRRQVSRFLYTKSIVQVFWKLFFNYWDFNELSDFSKHKNEWKCNMYLRYLTGGQSLDLRTLASIVWALDSKHHRVGQNLLLSIGTCSSKKSKNGPLAHTSWGAWKIVFNK